MTKNYIILKFGYTKYIAERSQENIELAISFLDAYRAANDTYVDVKDDENSEIYWHFQHNKEIKTISFDSMDVEAEERPKIKD
jgi:hypothetical protein|tara:strand:+ start:3194 stop:3442 length:249 start_codon:yes stop_codon:yes gene_type:complete